MAQQARPQRLEHLQTDRGLVPIYAKGTVEQDYSSYSEEDHSIWAMLLSRQEGVLENRACQEWLDARAALGLTSDGIPRFERMNEKIGRATGWQLVGVEGLLDASDFYDLLAQRKFPVTWWIRSRDQLDYLPEPDLFHDAYGHVPLLMLPVYANYMHHYAVASLRAVASGPEALEKMSKLYWFTVEFGLMGSPDRPRIYGAGIMSSARESVYATDDPTVQRMWFDPHKVMQESYRIDRMQDKYFVIPDLQSLYRQVKPILEQV